MQRRRRGWGGAPSRLLSSEQGWGGDGGGRGEDRILNDLITTTTGIARYIYLYTNMRKTEREREGKRKREVNS